MVKYNGEELQQVWRTGNGEANSSIGYYVWDVVEVIGHNGLIPSYFIECRDGSLIYIMCVHYFTLEAAGKALHYPAFDSYQVVTIVPEGN